VISIPLRNDVVEYGICVGDIDDISPFESFPIAVFFRCSRVESLRVFFVKQSSELFLENLQT
jgi:hypothetical protein